MPEANTEIQFDEATVKAETQRILEQVAAKHNRTVESLGPEVYDRAVEVAKERITADQGSTYEQLYKIEREKREKAESMVASVRSQAQRQNDPGQPAHTILEQAIARKGSDEWNNKMTDAQRFAAVGIDPENVAAFTKDAAKIFGSKSDAHLASDLHKSDPRRYRQLKLVAIMKGITGPSIGRSV